jgi:hypothetical protein
VEHLQRMHSKAQFQVLKCLRYRTHKQAQGRHTSHHRASRTPWTQSA